jgi:2-polyprenyl-3-methyl-5-hydroxy-6-metoxy-1,4-benzoquinol methylase
MERVSLEGTNAITNRPLEEYCARLEVDLEFLSGKKVLNFGCGGSNLKKDIEKIGKDGSGFVDVDIESDPIGSHADRFSPKEQSLRIKIQKRRNAESRDPQIIIPAIHDHEMG